MPMSFSLLPRERHFFVLFREDAVNVREALKTLDNFLNSEPQDFLTVANRLRDLEHKADEITHRIIHELNATFITPFDREDIYALASTMDDVVDYAEETADTVILDCVDSITDDARQMGKLLVRIGDELVQAIDQLDTRKNMSQHWVAMHALENEGDGLTRNAIGQLFKNNLEPLYVIKWKDVYSLLEKTIDRTEDIANILESITIKNA